jgi:squalene-associated FAD-dependent desaturase
MSPANSSAHPPTPGPSAHPSTPAPSAHLPTPSPSAHLPTPGPSAHPSTPRPSVAVIGGGLAGITAAIALAEAGAAVTLLEARPRLGGATCSFSRDGLTVDTGQHIFLGCCTAYRDLLGKLGMTEHAPVQHRFDVSVLAPGPTPRRGRLRRTALPGPLHMLPALGRYPFLSLAERASVARPALAMRFVDPARPGVDEQRFGDWLASHGQRERARRALWDLFSVSALNIAGDDASLSLAAFVVKTGLLGKNNAADIGVPALPLGELHGDAAAALLTDLGAQILLNAKVAAIEPGGGAEAKFRVRLARADDDGALPAEIPADAVVLAVPHEAAARLIPAGALPDATVAGWAGLGASPIVNVHVIYDRPVMDEPFVAAVDSPVQWVFDRTRISGLDRLSAPASATPDIPQRDEPRGSPRSSQMNPGVHLAAAGPGDPADAAATTASAAADADGAHGARGAGQRPQYLAISLSAADEYVDVPAATLREQFVPALAELFPAAREAQVTEFFVTRERRATFRQAPGTARLRPGAGTQLPGLVLAGAWTDTGWPDTMESAVRSGLAAAIELRRTVLSVPGQPVPGHPGSGQPAPGQTGSGQPALGQTGSGQPALGQTGSGQPALGQTGSGQPALRQTGSGQSLSGQPGSGYSDSGLSDSGLSGPSTSTIGIRQ